MGRIRNALTALLEEKAASPSSVAGANLVVSDTETNRPVLPVWTYDYLAKVAVTANSTVAAAADFWARNLSEPPLVVLDKPDGTPKPHPLSTIFANPNPFYTQDELWQAVIYALCASEQGAYIVAPLSRAGEPLALWPKSSDEVRIVPSTESYIGRYEVRVGSFEWRAVDPKQTAVIWFRLIHPTDKWASWPPVSKVRREIRTDTNMGRWVDYSLRNMGTSVVLGIDAPNLDTAVANQIRDYVNENMMTAHNARKASVVAGTLTKVDMGTPFSELDFGPLQDRIEVATARGFGLAPELLHILASTTAGNGLGGDRQGELKRQAYTDTLIPIAKMLAAKVASVFAPVYGLDPECVVFDFSGVQALRDDLDKAAVRLKNADGYVKLDEGRGWLALPPLPKGEGDAIPKQQQIAAFAARAAQPPAPVVVAAPADAAPPAPPAKGVKMLSGELLRKAVDDAAVALEPAFVKAAQTAFATQRARVMAHLGVKAGNITRLVENAIINEIAGGSDWREFDALVAEAMAAGASAHEASLGIAFDLASPNVLGAVTKRVTKLSGNVDATTIDAIRAVIADGRDSGAAMDDIAAGIGTVFDTADSSRAATIARTESMGAANEGGYTLAGDAVDAGIGVTKTWIAFLDSRTRPSHAMSEGETAAYDEPFGNGLMYPGDPDGDPEEVCNCRCSVGYEGAGPVPTNEGDAGA